MHVTPDTGVGIFGQIAFCEFTFRQLTFRQFKFNQPYVWSITTFDQLLPNVN